MVAEEGICVPQPLHLPSERPPSLCSILQGCHVPGMHTALSPSTPPSISSQPILLSAGSWEDWGALHGVRAELSVRQRGGGSLAQVDESREEWGGPACGLH